MTDREKVIKGLETCAAGINSCSKCPYNDRCRGVSNAAMAEAVKLLKNADLVKVVRCRDCRFWEPENAEEGDTSGRCRNDYAPCQNQQTDMTWFCADGQGRE